MIKRYNSRAALGLGNLSPDMSKRQKDAVERATEAKMEKHFQTYQPVPDGRNFHMWNHTKDDKAEKKFRDNFDRIFGPGTPGYGI